MDLSYRIMGLAARLLLALGVVCLLLGAYLLSQSMSLGEDTLRATGTVTGYREVRDGEEVRYRPRVRFTTPDGDIVAFEGQLATTSQRFAVGDQVPVQYPRTDPQKGRVALFADNWLGPIAAGGVGLLALIAGILVRRNVTNALKRSA
jgi:hypothetical protein